MGLFRKKDDGPSTAHYADVFRSARQRQRRLPRHRWQWVLLALVLLLAVGGGYGAYYYFTLQGDVQEDLGGEVTKRENRDAPFNVLLVGSDSRAGLTEEEQLRLGAGDEGLEAGERADTLILAHIDPETNHVTMVQFPRDLWVPIDGGRKNKINSALMKGSRPLIRTVEDLTGIDVNHYVKVNIVGFRDLVQAIGGVEVCVPEPIPFDKQTGLEVTEEQVGMVEFNGDDALRFVRSRHFATGDFERIRNQQNFIAAALDKILSTSTILRPARVNELADVARKNVVIDQNTTVLGLADIGRKMQRFDPDTYEAYTAPNLGSGDITVGGDRVSIVEPDFATMKVMFDAIRNNQSPAEADGVPSIDPETIRVGVYNGVGLERPVAGPAAAKLERATTVGDSSIRVVETANADNFRYRRTTIVWNRREPEAERMAELVAAALPRATVEPGRTKDGVDVAVTVGRGRFRTRRITQIRPIPIPKPGDLPEVCARDQASG